MTTTNNTTENNNTGIIVAFKIGRGGRFHNPGHLSFIGEKKIGEFTGDLFISFENQSDLYSLISGKENLEAKYNECADNEDFSFFKNRLGFEIGEQVYTDGCGNQVGLTVEEAETGIGRINIDHGYNTTYTCAIEDCSEDELKLIAEYTSYKSYRLEEYVKEALGLEEETEDEE